jgi:hypothetical protein
MAMQFQYMFSRKGGGRLEVERQACIDQCLIGFPEFVHPGMARAGQVPE